MYCSIQCCPKCVIALWFSVWWEEIAQVPAKTQQQSRWELWVQERKKHREIQAHAEERAGEVEAMGQPTFSLWVTVKSSLGDWTHILGADITSPVCVILYWNHQMPQFGQLLLSTLGWGATGYEIRKFHLSPRESVLLPGGDGRSWTPQTLWVWGMLQSPRAECSAEAGPTWAHQVMLNRVFFAY